MFEVAICWLFCFFLCETNVTLRKVIPLPAPRKWHFPASSARDTCEMLLLLAANLDFSPNIKPSTFKEKQNDIWKPVKLPVSDYSPSKRQ